jgi:hypothetical protein
VVRNALLEVMGQTVYRMASETALSVLGRYLNDR